MTQERSLKSVRKILLFFMTALFISGLTAIPIESELSFLLLFVPEDSVLNFWFRKVVNGYADVKRDYPFLLYGYDWLAFAHFILTILFIGPYRDPVKNKWVIEFGMIACVLVLPLAFIAGGQRGIPVGWQLIDCSFGVVGFIPLWFCYRHIWQIEKSMQSKIEIAQPQLHYQQ